MCKLPFQIYCLDVRMGLQFGRPLNIQNGRNSDEHMPHMCLIWKFWVTVEIDVPVTNPACPGCPDVQRTYIVFFAKIFQFLFGSH